MNRKQIESQFISEFENITPDFDKILSNIQSVNVPLTPTIERPKKVANPRYTNVWNRKATVEKSQPVRKIALSFMSLCTCMLLVVVSMFYTGVFALDKDIVIELDKKADSYVTLNINPEIDFAVNKFNKITTATAKNDGAKLLLAQMYNSLDVDTLVGMEVNGALMNAIDQATKMGYIDVDASGVTNAIMIDVISSNPKDSAATKDLLANEAKTYFVDKGIFAVVVTNYDSKAALVEEAKKANPNLDDSASVGELISAVEEVEGGKSMYEQEIERIKRENANYSTYLDGELINRVQYTTNNIIQDKKDLIDKNNKLLENLQAIENSYASEIDSLTAKINNLQDENNQLQIEIDKLSNGLDSYGDAGMIKEQIAANQLLIDECAADVVRYKDLIANIGSEYEQKLESLIRNQRELNLLIEQANKAIDANKIQNIDLEREKTATKNGIDNLNKEIVNANTTIDSYSQEMEQLRSALETISGEVTYNRNIANLADTVISLYDVTNIMSNTVLPKLNDIIKSSSARDKCVFCLPEYTMYNMIKGLLSPNKLLELVYSNYSDSMDNALINGLTKLYYTIIKDGTLFTEIELKYNANFANGQRSLIVNGVYNYIVDTANLKDIGLDDLLTNMSLAREKVIGLEYVNGAFYIDKADVINTRKLYNDKADALFDDYDMIRQDYIDLYSKITDQQSIILSAEKNIQICYARIEEIDTIVENNTNANKQLDLEVLNNNEKLQSVISDINNINQLKADTLTLYNEQLAIANQKLESLTDKATELDKALRQSIISNEETLQNHISTTTSNNVLIEQYNAQIKLAWDKITATKAQIIDIKTVNDGNNTLIDALKAFAADYHSGMRIDTSDIAFDAKFNQSIETIEQEITNLRNASEEEMQEEIRDNLDKMSQEKFNKNIEKFENHNQIITEEEYAQWEAEQSKIVDEYGWDAIYKAWQEK